ncbi:MAG TPA: PepSY-associated TM helix domain-containing protein [Parafilimonas sp.]|nr:PepSY-associated TM helix domain-containing protein [Parafilimonas sp.]
MFKIKNIKRWHWVHKWTSLICTIFLLNLCITGLPLIFADEIDGWLNPEGPFEQLPVNTPMTSLDNLIQFSEHRYPKQLVQSLFIDDETPQIFVTMAPTLKADDNLSHSLIFDSRTGKLLKDEPPFSQQPQTFIGFMLTLHADLFMDLPGELFLGLMGLFFVAAIVSGIVLYGPFMKKLNFGTVRYERTKKIKWLDLHNLLGIVIAAWMLVVGITGVMNELSTPLFGLWQNTDVKQMLQSYKNKTTPKQNELSSVQAAYNLAQQHVPGMAITSIVYPGYDFGSPYHYLFWTHGDKPLTSQLFTPVLVDGKTGMFSAVVEMPSYLRSLEISRPLHFGDYGGMPLKILWAVFDIAAIIVLISGLYLWFAKRKSKDEWLKQILQNENALRTENA